LLLRLLLDDNFYSYTFSYIIRAPEELRGLGCRTFSAKGLEFQNSKLIFKLLAIPSAKKKKSLLHDDWQSTFAYTTSILFGIYLIVSTTNQIFYMTICSSLEEPLQQQLYASPGCQ
jgi:hypothetical protein